MMSARDEFGVVVAAGTMASTSSGAVHFPHRWTAGGVSVHAPFTGAHLLHLAAAGCVLNDIYREAERLGVPLLGVRVSAFGGFDPATWQSTGIGYTIDVDSRAAADKVAAVLKVVDSVAEIPRAIRAGASVERVRVSGISRRHAVDDE